MTGSVELDKRVGTDEVARGDVVLEVSDLHVSFGSEAGRVDAVRGLSFDLRAGHTTAIVGESGSGKSVSAMAVLGLLPDTATVAGSVRLGGRELTGLSDKAMSELRGNEIAMVFQDPLSSLTPVYTVGAQLVEALRAHQKIGRKAAWNRAVELLDLVGITDPERRAKAFPHELSGGMRQRVMIAMAMANDPKIIIADEPTTALDVTIQAQILDLLKVAQTETGAAVLLITHDLGVVAGSADDVIVMYAGRPVERADVYTLFRRPRMPYTIGLLGAVPRVDTTATALVPIPGTPPLLINPPDACPFAPRCPVSIDDCTSAEPASVPVAGAVDHQVACIRAEEIDDDGNINGTPVFAVPDAQRRVSAAERDQLPVVLEVNDLRKEFPLSGGLLKRRVGSVRAVNGVSFDIRRGECLAIVGESGSGKSTTLTEIMELSQPAGVVRIGDVDPATVSKRAAKGLRRSMSIVFQDPSGALDPRFTAYDIIAEPLRALGVPRNQTQQKVTDLLRRVGLDPAHADRFPAAFSGGQRQRLAIARALATDPTLVILDEPLSALDVSVQADIVNLIRELQQADDVAYLVVAHDLAVIRHLADRVAVMYRGDFVEIGDIEQVFDHPAHPYTRRLLSAVPIPDPQAQRSRVDLIEDETSGGAVEFGACEGDGPCVMHPVGPGVDHQVSCAAGKVRS